MGKTIDDKFKGALNDLEKYKFRGVAHRAYSKGDEELAKGALKAFVKDADPEYYEDFINYTLDSPEGVKYASLKNKKFGEALESLPISVLTYAYYNDYIEKYADDENKDVLKKILVDYKDRTYGDVSNTYLEALDIIKAQSNKYSEEDKKNAMETVREYKRIMGALDLMEETRYEVLRPKAAEESLSVRYNAFAKELTNGG